MCGRGAPDCGDYALDFLFANVPKVDWIWVQTSQRDSFSDFGLE
jgi:hypothetical protein